MLTVDVPEIIERLKNILGVEINIFIDFKEQCSVILDKETVVIGMKGDNIRISDVTGISNGSMKFRNGREIFIS